MRTTLELPDALVNEALALTKIPAKTELVKFALENVIQREKTKELANYFGKTPSHNVLDYGVNDGK